MQLHVLLLNGATLQMPVDDKFKLGDWLAILRRDGYIAQPGTYISAHAVLAAIVVDPSATSEVTLSMANKLEGSKPN